MLAITYEKITFSQHICVEYFGIQGFVPYNKDILLIVNLPYYRFL